MSSHKLYGGDITLVAEKRGRKGGYWIGDENITRVTSVGVPMPFAPACWYGAGLASKKFLSMLPTDGTSVQIDDPDAWAEKMRKAAGDTTLRDRGTEGHRIIQQIIEFGGYNAAYEFDGLEVMLKHWRKWWNEHEIEVHGVEKKVYSKEFEYAGTLDFDATINGMRSLVDWKFGKIRPAVRIQTAAYSQARSEELGILYDQRMVVSISEDGVKTEIYEEQDKDFSAFLNLLEYHRWLS